MPCLRREVTGASLRKQTPARRLTRFTFSCGTPSGMRPFSLIQKAEHHRLADPARRDVRIHNASAISYLTVYEWPLCRGVRPNGTHLERKITDVNVLSRHNAHTSLHFTYPVEGH